MIRNPLLLSCGRTCQGLLLWYAASQTSDACRAVEAAAESASDVVGRAFWWSNCIQLRWMLWAMSHGGSLDSEYGQELGGSVDDFDWVMQVTLGLPALRAGYPEVNWSVSGLWLTLSKYLARSGRLHHALRRRSWRHQSCTAACK